MLRPSERGDGKKKNHTSLLICIDGLEETSMLCSSVRGEDV